MASDQKKKTGRFSAMRKTKRQGDGEKVSSVARRQTASASSSSPTKLTAFVKVFGSEGERDRIYPLDKKDEYTVGRTSNADIPLADRKVSRKHCKIVRKGMLYFVVDLNSRNGTFVGGKKVKRRLLKDGDLIQVGLSRLLFFKAKKADVILQFVKERKCALCGKTVSQADLLSGKAEEVNGSVFCSACVAQAMGEEIVAGATPAGMTPPPSDATPPTISEEAKDKSATPSPQQQPAKSSSAQKIKDMTKQKEASVRRSAVHKRPATERKAAYKALRKTAQKKGTTSPSSVTAKRSALKQKLQRSVKATPKTDGVESASSVTDEDASKLRKQGHTTTEAIRDQNASDLAALSEPPKLEDISAFKDADVDKLIDELLEEEQ
ncbi:MAG: hypothetical protein DRP82_02135 [Planctomycetota bacterium]|nr:MAG: hypothetical protein DRP82_02135 [Planctomycetota bacterium]